MIESLKNVQDKGQEMVDKIQVQEEMLRKVKEKEAFARTIDQERRVAEEMTKKLEEDLRKSETRKSMLES